MITDEPSTFNDEKRKVKRSRKECLSPIELAVFLEKYDILQLFIENGGANSGVKTELPKSREDQLYEGTLTPAKKATNQC